MKRLVTFFAITIITLSLHAQTEQIPEEKKSFNKHEIGFSVGAFPIVGLIVPVNEGWGSIDDRMGHTYNIKSDDNYEKMYHLGSYTFNYNYHFNSKRSIGGSLSWVGKHIDTYWEYPSTSFFGSWSNADTINGSGWKHYFTLQGNYRNTYYRKNDIIAFYWGINYGITLCIRNKDILPKETIDFLVGTESNVRTYFAPAMHLNLFGIEIGKEYVLNLELGIGTQGLIKIGYKYKF